VKTLDVGAVGRGALAGLLVIVPLTALRAVVDRDVSDFDHSGWLYLFGLGLLVAYIVAGTVAGRRAPDAPLTNGILAGIGALVLWIPLRILIWAARGESHGLVTGFEPVFTAGQLFGQLLFASAFGLIGAVFGARSVRRTPVPGSNGSGSPAPPRG
jgi:hypothetical protein